jgi:hypothetical protein
VVSTGKSWFSGSEIQIIPEDEHNKDDVDALKNLRDALDEVESFLERDRPFTVPEWVQNYYDIPEPEEELNEDGTGYKSRPFDEVEQADRDFLGDEYDKFVYNKDQAEKEVIMRGATKK